MGPHDRPLLSLGFPPGVLFDMVMRGGPLPDRYDHLRGGLVNPGQLDFFAVKNFEERNSGHFRGVGTRGFELKSYKPET